MRAAIAILMACTLALAPSSALAEEHVEDRSYDVTISEQRAEIQIPQEVGEQGGETTVVLDTEEGLLSGAFGLTDDEDAGQRLDIRLHQLVEYVDKNGNDELDEDDRVASAWNLANASKNATADRNGTVQWQALASHDVTSEDGVEGTQIEGVAEFPEQDPIAGVMQQLGQGENRTLRLNLTVFEDATSYEGTDVSASHVHAEWTIDNYPYTREETKLALVANAETPGALDLGLDEERPRLASQGDVEDLDVGIEATIAEHALVDGNETDVNATLLDAGEDVDAENVLGLHYERGTVITHGLVLGSNVDTSSTSVIESGSDTLSEVPAPGALAALSLLAAAAVVLGRR